MISWLRSLAGADREPEMTQQRWARVTEIVDGASKRPGRRQRARYLAQACRGDRALRREVEDLLRYEDAESEVLAGPLLPPPVRPPSRPALVVGQAIGPYRVERILGGGGMGMVALAVDPELDLRVALKVIRRELVSAELIQRFHRERRLLARLEHPGIARILGGGEVDGLPWFAMEYVEGEPLDVYCDRNRLAIDERLSLVSKICAALEYAHRNLVVHQDLKPSNLLVTAEGEPKLLDFGIARQIGEQQESPAANLQTGGGRRLLTPACASPEQIRGLAITTATDIYSLGVLLYELLCGHPPYLLDGDSFENASKICDQESKSPSSMTVVAREVWHDGVPKLLSPVELSRLRGSDPRRLRRRLRGDLDGIVLQALAKCPADRYRSMEQLRDDLRRHLAGLPVTARRATVGYRTGKFVLRNRRQLSTVALAVVLVLAGVGLRLRSTAEIARIESRAAEQSRLAEGRADALAAFVSSLLRASDPDESAGEVLTAEQILDRAEQRVRDELRDEPEQLAFQLEAIGIAYQKRGRITAAIPVIEDSLRLRIRLYGGDHPLVARGLNNLGVLRRDADGRHAEKLYRLALGMRRRLGQDPEEQAKVQSNLAAILMHRGEYSEAERLYRQTLRIRLRAYGPDDADVATTLRSLGTLFYLQDRFADAEPLMRRALSIREQRYGRHHTRVAAALSSLGRVLLAQRRWWDAEKVLSEALSIRRELLGDDHPHVAVSRKDLAALYFDLGESAVAEVLWTQAVAVLTASRGPDSWEIADAESLLGGHLAAQGRYQEAKACLAGSYETLRRVRGEGAIYTRAARRRLDGLRRLNSPW